MDSIPTPATPAKDIVYPKPNIPEVWNDLLLNACTQSEYDAMPVHPSNVVYFIVEG